MTHLPACVSSPANHPSRQKPCADIEGGLHAEAAVRTLLHGIGENVEREGLIDTPKRVAKAFREVTAGHRQPLDSVLGTALFHDEEVQQGGSSWVVVRDVEFASTSEATLLPFFGRCHIAYIPSRGVVLGLSKLARLTKLCAKRIQTQAAFAHSILDTLNNSLRPLGAAVVVVATHLQLGDPPAQHIATAVAGCFGSGESSMLEELSAVLELDLHAVGSLHTCSERHPCLHQPTHLSSSVLCMVDGVTAPTTPDPSDQDTDMESDSAPSTASTDTRTMEAAVKQLLRYCGEDPNRMGLQGSARRYIMSLLAATSGYQADPMPSATDFGPLPPSPRVSASFPGGDTEDMEAEAEAVVISHSAAKQGCGGGRGGKAAAAQHGGSGGCGSLAGADAGAVQLLLPFCSLCEHHMLPFNGHVVVSYLPGLGCRHPSSAQLEQLLSAFSQRLQIQERITHQVADAVQQLTSSPGVAVMCSAAHMCMVARGVESSSSTTLTTAVRGSIAQEPKLRAQLLGRMAAAIRAARS